MDIDGSSHGKRALSAEETTDFRDAQNFKGSCIRMIRYLSPSRVAKKIIDLATSYIPMSTYLTAFELNDTRIATLEGDPNSSREGKGVSPKCKKENHRISPSRIQAGCFLPPESSIPSSIFPTYPFSSSLPGPHSPSDHLFSRSPRRTTVISHWPEAN